MRGRRPLSAPEASIFGICVINCKFHAENYGALSSSVTYHDLAICSAESKPNIIGASLSHVRTVDIFRYIYLYFS